MKLSSINQAIKSLRILKTSLLTSLFVFTYHFLFSQCTSDQLEFQVEVTTDQWGYEAYWEITEQNSDCGVNTVFSGGNSAVGCLGGGLQVAAGSDPGAYSNNTTVLSLPFCLDLDSCYTFHMVDDYGDGGTSYNILVSGFNGVLASLESQGTMNSDVFCATVPPAYDIALDVNSEDANGWNLNHIRPVPDPFYPINQLNQNETFMGVNVVNYGFQSPTGVYVRLNIDKEDISGNWNTVFTDTLDFSNVGNWNPVPSEVFFRTKEINDESWYSLGNFRYQYIAHQDITDQNPSNDTITGYFTLTEDYWSRVTMDSDGNPYGTNTYIPGTNSELTGYEWGSFFHFPAGSGVTVEELKTKFLISSTSQLSSFPYQANIYEVNSNGTGLNLPDDLLMVGLGLDTLSGNPGDTIVGIIDSFYDITNSIPGTLVPFVFQNDKLYYISIYQENFFPPYLNDGTTTNGLMIFGENLNHDFHVYNSNSESYPFFNPFRDEQNGGVWTWYSQGWTNSPEPSIGIKFGGCLQNSSSTQTQTACSSYLWPANGATYTNSGQYIEVLSNVNGCDSVVTLDLTINQPSATIDIQTACDSYQWIDGNTYTESTNVPALTLTNSFGCDSVVTLDLTIFNSSSSLMEQTVCDGYFWEANQTYYESTGEYSTLVTNQEGCDSLITLDLTVNQVVITSEPLDQNVPVNESAQFSVSTNEQNTAYQWQINNGLGFQNLSDAGQYSGTNTQDLNISFVQFFQNNTQFRCILTNQTNCSDTSEVAVLTVEGNASLEELKQQITISPNPTTNLITIQSESLLNNKFKIYDQQGREVMNGKLTGKNTEVSLSKLSRGTYTIQVDGNYKPAVIIKQ